MNSPNDSNMDKNNDKSRFNCYFLGDFTIVTLNGVAMGENILIAYQYNIDKIDSKTIKESATDPTKK